LKLRLDEKLQQLNRIKELLKQQALYEEEKGQVDQVLAELFANDTANAGLSVHNSDLATLQ
jgi:hypothetical protein